MQTVNERENLGLSEERAFENSMVFFLKIGLIIMQRRQKKNVIL